MFELNDEMRTQYEIYGLQADIINLDLSVRAYNALKRAGVFTLEDLLNVSVADLWQMRHISAKSAAEIMEAISSPELYHMVHMISFSYDRAEAVKRRMNEPRRTVFPEI